MPGRSGRRRPATLALALGLLLACAGPAPAAPDDVPFEGETMSVAPAGAGGDSWDNAATGPTGNWAKHLWANGTASKTVTTTRSSVHLFARVKPSVCEGPPEITIKAGGKQWWSGPVNGAADGAVNGEKFRYIGARISLPQGTHTVEISFTNNFDRVIGTTKVCDRGVLIDKVTLVATPFSATGWRNAPLSSTTPVASNSLQLVGDIQRMITENQQRPPDPNPHPGVWMSAGHDYGTPIYTVPDDQPRVRVRHPAGDNPGFQAQIESVPLPPDAQPQSGTDGSLVVWQPSTDTLWDFWQLKKNALGEWEAAYGGRLDNVSQNEGNWEPPPNGPGKYGASATSIALLAGAPRIEEMKRGVIDHAVDFSIRGAQGYDGWCWPAQRTDPQHVRRDSAAIPAGTRFRFPANLDLSQYNLTPFGLMWARAIQNYGMVLRDSGDGFGFWAEDWTPTGQNPYPTLWGNEYPNENGAFRNIPWDKLVALAQPPGKGCQDDPDVHSEWGETQ